MALMRWYAIGIDELRDMFGADEAHASALRGVAAAAFPPPAQRKAGLLDKLGPLFRRDARLAIDPAMPTAEDVTGLLSGRFVPPQRVRASWLILDAWLRAYAWGVIERPLGQAEVDDLEFALARAGLPSPLAIGTLLANDPQIPLSPPPGTSIGYAKYPHACAVRNGLRSAVPQLDGARAEQLASLVDFLGSFDGWAASAHEQRRPPPDLLMVWDRT